MNTIQNAVRTGSLKIIGRVFSCLAMSLASCILLVGAASEAAPLRVSQIVGFSSGNLGAVGSSEGWGGTSGNYTVTSGSGSLDGTGLGLYPSAGDKVDLASSSTINSLNTHNTFAASGDYPPSLPNNLYYSFLWRFNTLTNMSSTWSNKIAQVNRLASSSGVHFWLHAMTNASGKIVLGLMKPGGTPAYASKELSAGEVFLVVLRQQIIPGSANDQVDLWINPAPASFGAAEGSEPSPDVSASSGTEDPSTTGPGRFYIFAGVSASFDELRISANSWADVTPSLTSCIPAALDSDPSDATVTEGIGATFSVTSESSSPTYMWQVSTDNGATWANVADGRGITAPTYTTPPLELAANQNRYRAIASVVCGGGSHATSAVAVVTVNAAMPTPPGVIVDDTFADLSRANTPIGPNNTLWFSSTTGSLSDGSTGNLIGVPGSETSRLWISYFTESAPVHLAVGRSLKVTLEFSASNIAETGGTSMRFGIFDYADGGARVTEDNFGSGSSGSGSNVLGYVLVQHFGQTFTNDTTQQLYARSVIDDNNLMGSTGNYFSLGTGPAGTNLEGAPGFAENTPYTLELVVKRVTFTSNTFTATITGGGTNYTTTVNDGAFAYPRFDAFAMRPASRETTANPFTFTRFKAEVLEGEPAPISLDISRSGQSVTLTWADPAFKLQAAPEISATFTNVADATSPYTVPAADARNFYRLQWP